MRKVKLTESDINSIVQRVIEQEERVFEGTDDEFKRLLFEYTHGWGHILNKMYDKFIITTDVRLRSNQMIKTLPENLTIKGYLSLSLSSIIELPKNLTCTTLSISCTNIKYLPKNLKCGHIYINKTPIFRAEGLLKYYEDERKFKFNKAEIC